MASIFDVFGRLLLDDKQFQADAAKAGDQAGLTVGKRMSLAVKQVGAKVIGGALAAGFGLAAKGAVELENAVASFQAATGASAEEAKAAGKVINRVSGEERTSLEAVTEAAIRVKRDLGATGDEAALLTKQFVRFARVTRQDAAGAVSAYDDILDSWGLTAKDAGRIMDSLLVSQQRFGGEITETQKTLAALAPAMRAANFEIDDGIALLGLFGAKGLDAGQASAAFAKALTKVKSPEELKALIADISATEDPFERAQKAADLFGAKAGAKLANALAGANLDDYAISVEDAAGATERAADALDNTFSGRIQKALSIATAQLREFGAGFGPALTGLAALASLAGSLGGGKLVLGIVKPFGKLGGLLKGKILAAIMSAIIPATIAGEAVGEATTTGMSKGVLGKGKAAFSKALEKLGSAGGGILGKALAVGFAAVAVVELVKTFSDVTEQIRDQTADLAAKTAQFTQDATLEALLQAREGVAQQLNSMGHDPIAEALGLSARKGVEDTLGQLEAEIAKRTAAAANRVTTDVETMRGNVADSLSGVRSEARTTGTSASTSFGNIGAAAARTARAVSDGAATMKQIVADLRTKLAEEARAMISGYYDPLMQQDSLRATNAEIAAQREIIASKSSTKQQVADAKTRLHQLGADQAEYLLKLAEAGQTSSKAYKDGIKSLKTAISEAKGPAKAALQEILNKILEVERAGKVVPINVKVSTKTSGSGLGPGGHATGGPMSGGEVSWVGEGGGYRELFVAPRAGTVIPHRQSEALVRGLSEPVASGPTTIQVMLPVREAPDPFETADAMRRLNDFGVLTVPPKPRTRP